MITVFTPVYNRAHTITRLYESLCRQSSKNFEWVIVDDGSSDDIGPLIGKFISEDKVRIKFVCQTNGGKHRAINTGIKVAKGEFFIIVDSDDYITDDAIEWIELSVEEIRDDSYFAGIAGLKLDHNGTKIGEGVDFGIIDANAIDIRLRHNVRGDLAEVFKTEVLRQYPFPEFNDEKFCPEALVWFRIARKYKLRYYYKGIYVCEYLPDGLTAKITQLRMKSPCATMTYYAEHFHDAIHLKWKLKAATNFWRFNYAPYSSKYDMMSLTSLVCWIPGKLMQLLDKYK